MNIAGLTKLSLIDYPGNLACIIFTQGCNLRCPFCHNPDILEIKSKLKNSHYLDEDIFFKFLKTRFNKLDGVVITGGEPTLQTDLINFIIKIKTLGFKVKLDSNGTNPGVLKKLIEKKLVNYIAMDIKHISKKYKLAAGSKINIKKIQESIILIKNSNIDYEFRTTIVPGIHTFEDIVNISKVVSGAKQYFLQKYRQENTLKKIPKSPPIDLSKVRELIKNDFGFVGIRG